MGALRAALVGRVGGGTVGGWLDVQDPSQNLAPTDDRNCTPISAHLSLHLIKLLPYGTHPSTTIFVILFLFTQD